jgi:uncharacterized surface protein with fasciclin (FAS1) repeats
MFNKTLSLSALALITSSSLAMAQVSTEGGISADVSTDGISAETSADVTASTDSATGTVGDAVDGAMEGARDTAQSVGNAVQDAADAVQDTAQSATQETVSTLRDLSASGTANVGASTNAEAVVVGGAPMSPEQNIVENASLSADHTNLVNAVVAADMAKTLQSEGPFTVFAPTNAAFDKIAPDTLEQLMLEENKASLQKILGGHVVSGDITSADLAAEIQASDDGYYHFTTISGDALSATMQGESIAIIDENGNASIVTIADVDQSNGVVHVVDTVLIPS